MICYVDVMYVDDDNKDISYLISLISSHLISSHIILYYLISSHLISSHLILSYLINWNQEAHWKDRTSIRRPSPVRRQHTNNNCPMYQLAYRQKWRHTIIWRTCACATSNCVDYKGRHKTATTTIVHKSLKHYNSYANLPGGWIHETAPMATE